MSSGAFASPSRCVSYVEVSGAVLFMLLHPHWMSAFGGIAVKSYLVALFAEKT